jgi:hypothetical protein
MEMAKNKDDEIDLDNFNPGGGRGMHQRNEMNGRFGSNRTGMNGGMPNGEMELRYANGKYAKKFYRKW